METSQTDIPTNQSHSRHQNSTTPPKEPDFFAFLLTDKKEPHPKPSSFFSVNGLSQDIIQVTGAGPDICLEVFYALYNTLWPQIDHRSDVALEDAWTKLIGGAVFKGILCPPEKLISERRIKEVKRILSEPEGEAQIFHDFDQVVDSILHLKQKIEDFQESIQYQKEVIKSLCLVKEFYQSYRNKVKVLVQVILQKERMNAAYGLEADELEDLLEPKAIMMSDVFPNHWAYRIQRSQAQKLLALDMHGRILKNNNINSPSNHRITALPEKSDKPLVFFKANGNPPIQPEKEFMLYSLYQYLQIPVPETALIILTDVFETSPDNFYAVQASEAVLGESPLKACQDPDTIFDHEAYVSQVIAAFLTNPSDGSFQNFKYSPKYKTLISIDNDLVFEPELAEMVVNVKSMLYLLPQIDFPVPESVQTLFTTLDPHLLVSLWLQDLSQKNREYQLLFTRLAFQKTRCLYQNLLPQNEVPSLPYCFQQKITVNSELHGEYFKPQILVSQNLLSDLIKKLQLIEKILSKNHLASTQMLFEEISQILGKYYRKLRFEFSDIKEALEALWGSKKNGVNYSYISSLLDQEELTNLRCNTEFEKNLPPEILFKEYKDILNSKSVPLNGFLQRHFQRIKKDSFKPQVALKELQFLIQEDLIQSQYPQEIVDLCHSLSQIPQKNDPSISEIISLLFKLPNPDLHWLFTLEKYFYRIDRPFPGNLVPFSLMVNGAFMKQRRFALTESESQYLFDKQGNIKKSPFLTGRSAVTCFPKENPEFYLKQYPEYPGYEFASILFMKLLGIQHLPYQDLLIFNNNFPVLLSQQISGNVVSGAWKMPGAFHNLDPFHTGLLIISAMLINPEDGKEDNFILSPDKKYLVPIDNDHCFLPGTFQKEGNFWNAFTVNTALQTKTILFCLDEMYMKIPSGVSQHILSINFDSLLFKWMTAVDKLETELNNLASKTQHNQFLEHGTVIRIPFYKQFIQSLHWKAHKIQEILKTTSQSTPFDLLKAVEPFAAKCYENAFKQYDSLKDRFKAATRQLYTQTTSDGSRMSILNTQSMMKIINISAEDLQNDAAFQKMGPADSLEQLNQLIQKRSQQTYMEQDMLCELDDSSHHKKWINLFGNPPALKAFLENPKEVLALKASKLITSNKLTELFVQAPNTGTRIRFLSLPESPFLTHKGIRILAEQCPNIEYLNVSGCKKLKEIVAASGEWPFLSRLEAKDCDNLEKLVSYSPIRILRIGVFHKVQIFVEQSTLDYFLLSNLSSSSNFCLRKLEDFELQASFTKISKNDFGRKYVLEKHSLPSLLFSEIKIGKYSILSIEDLAVFVTVLDLKSLTFSTKTVQRITALNLLNLTRLDLSCGTITTSALKTLIKANWPKLHTLDFSSSSIDDEGLQILARANWSLLENLDLNNTKITMKGTLNFILKSKSRNLKGFKCAWSDFAADLLQDSPHISKLDLSRIPLAKHEIESIVYKFNWPQLKSLNLSNNEEIDDEGLLILCQGNWPQLETLNLQSTKVTPLGAEILAIRQIGRN